jgi:hypothetical protein
MGHMTKRRYKFASILTLAVTSGTTVLTLAVSANAAPPDQATSVAGAQAAGWINIGGAMYHPSCVHEIPNGASVQADVVTLNGATVAHYSKCAYEAVGGMSAPSAGSPAPRPSNASPNSSFPPPSSCVDDVATCLPQSQSALASSTSSSQVMVPPPGITMFNLTKQLLDYPPGVEFTNITEQWIVPPIPSNPSPYEVMWIWTALRSYTAGTILQRVQSRCVIGIMRPPRGWGAGRGRCAGCAGSDVRRWVL